MATTADCLTAFAICGQFVDLNDAREEFAATQVLAEELLNWAEQQADTQRAANDASKAYEWPANFEERKHG